MIQNPSKELTLIVYNSPKPPRYIALNKKLLKLFILIIPSLIIFSITLTFTYSIFLKNKINTLKAKEPELIQKFKDSTKELEKNIAELTKNNSILTQKLTLGDTTDKNPINGLSLITPPVGVEDLRLRELLKIEEIKLSSEKNTIKLNFNLANNTEPQTKLAGFISVIMYQGNTIQYYPENALSLKNLRIDFTQGESFSFSRFRPTIAKFKKTSTQSAQFKIFIFSRTGNLLALKQIGPFNIE